MKKIGRCLIINHYDCLTPEEYEALDTYIEMQFEKIDHPDMQYMLRHGLLFPDRVPKDWDTLPDEWEEIMETKGIVNLYDYELEKYLEKWLRLLGHAYWVLGIKQARRDLLQRCADYVYNFIFAHASGGREQKAAVAGSHPLYKKVLDRLIDEEKQLSEISGLVRKWEKVEFSISRAITNRAGKPTR